MSYQHLTIEERTIISQLYKSGVSIRKIAHALHRSPSTISREIKRNRHPVKKEYFPLGAQRKYKARRASCHRKISMTDEVRDYIAGKIKSHWSPEQIVNRGKLTASFALPCLQTVYNWIHSGLVPDTDIVHLRRKGRFKRPQETRGRFNGGPSINKRPKAAWKRSECGHWEGDTVVSGKNDRQLKSKSCFVTLADRKSRTYLFKQIPNRKAEVVTAAIIDLLGSLPPGMVKTITFDRGKEFSGWKELEEKLGCSVYFCDAYCSWQKGTNENSNGLLREYFPKSCDIGKATEEEIKVARLEINNRPRKCLDWQTPLEVLGFVPDCCT